MINETLARDAINSVRKTVEEGETIVRTARDDYHLGAHDSVDDGPKMEAWRKGERSITAPSWQLSEDMANIIRSVINSDHGGRAVVACAALANLRERYDAIDKRDLPDEIATWETFAARHIPLPAERVSEMIGRMVHAGGLMRCSKCSAKSKAGCGCGVPYVGAHPWASPIGTGKAVEAEPVKADSALGRAMTAVVANPEKSDRAIAAEIGVSNQTVKRARQHVTPDVTPDRRRGRDGRSYPAHRGRALPPQDPDRDLIQDEMHPDLVTEEERWQWSAANLFGDVIAAHAYWQREFGDWQKFRPPKELVILMDQASEALKTLKPERRKSNGKTKT